MATAALKRQFADYTRLMTARPAAALIPLALLYSGCASAPPSADPALLAEIRLIRAVDNHAHPVRVVSPGQPPDRGFDALPVDESVASSFGQLAAQVAAIGRQPRARTMDLLIAATAHAHSARLYTRNPADFVGLEKLVPIIAV